MGIEIRFRKIRGKPYLTGKYVVVGVAECPLSANSKSLHSGLRSIVEKDLELKIKRKVIEDSLDELQEQYSGSFLISTIPVRVIVDSSVKESLLVVNPDDYSRIIELEGFMFLESEVDEHRNRPD